MDKKFTEEKYKHLYIPIHLEPPFINLIEKYNHLLTKGGNKEFIADIGELDRNKVIRYIVLMYDPHTPFDDYVLIGEKKMLAAIEAGFELGSNGRFAPMVEEMIMGKIAEVNAMIYRYLFFTSTPTVNQQRTLMEANYIIQQQISQGEFKAENLKFMKEATEVIEAATERLLKGDKSQDTISQYYRLLSAEPINMRPEDIAKMMTEGKPIQFAYESEED